MFPRGYAPLDVRGHAWPGCFIPDEALMLDETLESPKVQLAQRGGRPTAELRVRRPVVGFAYSISWQLPRAEERRSVT